MRVTCPECESKFRVPEQALGPAGRKLRCSKCGHEWFQEPVGGKPAAKGKPKARSAREPEPPADEPELEARDAFHQSPDADLEAGELRAMREEAEMEPPPLGGGLSRFRVARPPEPTDRRLPTPLLALAAAAVAIPAILFAGRAALVEMWPATALLYDTVGLHVPVPGEGLVLQNVYVQRRQEGSVPLLVVTGEIRNPGDELRSLPALRGTVLDAHGDELQSWLFTAEVPQLLPGDTGRFQSELAAPAEAAAKVNVTFTDDRPEGGIGY